MRSLLIFAGLALGLAACTETTTAQRAPTVAPGVPIAVESISGAPDAMRGSFSSALSSEASARRVDIVDPATNPRYRVRGYLAAQPTEDGQTALAFVWDVFDAQKRRAQRVQGATVARGSSGDWTSVDQITVNKAAAESMDQIAQFLAAQDQAVAGSSPPSAGAAVARAAAANAAASTPTLALRR
ncbi:MAG: hypothetical protein NTZ14_14335 [Hyphomicrobiales bacterium]|nr:hypothetical protein [Hyphomicrobiales bacterium]